MSGIAMLFPLPAMCPVTIEGELLLPLVVLEDLQLLGDAHGVPWCHLYPHSCQMQASSCKVPLLQASWGDHIHLLAA